MRPATPDGYSLLLSADFHAGEVTAVRRRVAEAIRRWGLRPDAVGNVVLAVNEAMTNAVRHGGGAGRVVLWAKGDLRCEISDRGKGFAAEQYQRLTRRPTAGAAGGMGLWIARQVAHRLTITSGPAGTTVTITATRD